MAAPGHRHVRTRITAWGFVALAALAVALPGCSNEEPVVATPRGPNLPSQEVTDRERKESDTGRPECILVSKYAATYPGGLIVARNAVNDFYDRVGEQYSRLTARS